MNTNSREKWDHFLPVNIDSNHLGQPIGNGVAGWVPPAAPVREASVGRFCRLEPLDVTCHSKDLFTAFQDDDEGHDWTYLPYGPFPGFTDYREWMQNACLGDDPLFFAICDLKTGEATGLASYLNITPGNGSIEVGHIHFSPKLKKTNAATEAMYLMMRRAFESGYRRYEWKCHAMNGASRAAAQRLGLSFEGVFRQHMVVKGRNRDSAWYAAIDEEWPALREAFTKWLSPENFDDSGRQRIRLSDLTAPILQRKHHET
ncbi:MAG: GNAT family N-acetyltransferase [Verrucomicrobiae bacterium]|nr:GNAT family N-acetyltransferase [Verrucomicrobiae bacterium]